MPAAGTSTSSSRIVVSGSLRWPPRSAGRLPRSRPPTARGCGGCRPARRRTVAGCCGPAGGRWFWLPPLVAAAGPALVAARSCCRPAVAAGCRSLRCRRCSVAAGRSRSGCGRGPVCGPGASCCGLRAGRCRGRRSGCSLAACCADWCRLRCLSRARLRRGLGCSRPRLAGAAGGCSARRRRAALPGCRWTPPDWAALMASTSCAFFIEPAPGMPRPPAIDFRSASSMELSPPASSWGRARRRRRCRTERRVDSMVSVT